MSREKIIARVRKLLNLNADTSDFEGEIAAVRQTVSGSGELT